MADFYVPMSSSATIIRQQAPGETTKIRVPLEVGTTVYISNNSGVTTTTGFPAGPGTELKWVNGNANTIYGITASGTACTLRVSPEVSSSTYSVVS